MDIDDSIFPDLFSSEGATALLWEVGTPCPNVDPSTKQPVWDCPLCSGSGVIPLRIRSTFLPSVGRTIVATWCVTSVSRTVAHEVCSPWFNNVVSIATSK